jgi:hypothetical protein
MSKLSVEYIYARISPALLFVTSLGVACASPINPFANDQPPLTPPPLPGPVTGAAVYNGGAILRNISNQNAEDVRLSFRIPTGFLGLASENINQGSLIAGLTQTVSTALTFGNQVSSQFDQDIVLRNPDGSQLVVPPHQSGTTVGDLSISVLLDSKNTNGVFWRTSTLTDANGNPIPTKFFGGSFMVTAQSALTYTFTNDSTDSILVNSITLGTSPSLIDAQTFSSTTLGNVQVFPEGLTLAPGGSLPIPVPTDLPGGTFLVADVLATGDPGTSDPVALRFVNQHESVPEPGTLTLFAAGAGAIILFLRRRAKSCTAGSPARTKVCVSFALLARMVRAAWRMPKMRPQVAQP